MSLPPRLGLAAALALAALAANAADTAQPGAAAAEYRVEDTFAVGESIYVRALRLDPAGNSLWVGTSAGVHEIDLATLKPRHTFTRHDGLANEYVFAIGIDSQGYKWFGTNAGGASRYKDGQWKTYFPMHGLADYWVYSFANDATGNLWIGTWAGANRFDLATGAFRTYVKELVNEWVYGLDVDGGGRVWFGTEGGVSMYDGSRWHSWTHRDGLGAANDEQLPASSNTGLGTRSRHDLTTTEAGTATYNPSYVFAVHATAKGEIWAGTWGGGAARFDGRTWRNYTTRDGLAGNIVYAIAGEPGGALWFGTDQGVSRYDGETWHTLRAADGLLDSHVHALAAGPGDTVWVGTRGGVTRLARKAP